MGIPAKVIEEATIGNANRLRKSECLSYSLIDENEMFGLVVFTSSTELER
jgi:hypothetical protein